MREIYGFSVRLASRLTNPFAHPSQVRTQVLVLRICVDLRVSLASGLKYSTEHIARTLGSSLTLANVTRAHWCSELVALESKKKNVLGEEFTMKSSTSLISR